MTDSTSAKPEYDPFALWRPMMTAWAKAVNESGASEETAKAMLSQMNQFMEATAPLQQQTDKFMEQYVHQLNLPTRTELMSLSERLTNLELRLDDQDAKLDELLTELRAVRELLATPPKPKKAKGA